MQRIFSLKGISILLFLALCLYFLFYILNLTILPIPWVDEVGYLDPAFQFVNNGFFGSNLWPQEGTQQHFVAHLPALQWWFSLFWLGPDHIFWMRLSQVVAALLGTYFITSYCKKEKWPSFLISLFLVLFLFDKAVFEDLRSMRMEVLEFCLFGAVLLYSKKTKLLTAATFNGFLAMTHPKIAMISLAFLFYHLYAANNKEKPLVLLMSALPSLCYLAMAGFNVQTIIDQLIVHGSDHTIHTVPGNQLWKHFIGRFMLYDQGTQTFSWYYKWQPYLPWIHVLGMLSALGIVIKKTRYNQIQMVIAWSLILTEIYWFAVLGPFHRYNLILILLSYLNIINFLLPFSNRLKTSKKYAFLVLFLLPTHAFPVASRHFGALAQKNARSEVQFNNWLLAEMKPKNNQKILIIEPATAYYLAIKHPNIDFALQKYLFNFQFADYDQVYFISLDPKPELKFISKYDSNTSEKWLRLGGVTHHGMRLYEITNQQQYEQLIDWKYCLHHCP